MKRTLLFPVVVLACVLYCVSAYASPEPLVYTGTGVDCLGTDQFEYELTMLVRGHRVIGTLTFVEFGTFLLQNGSERGDTISFFVELVDDDNNFTLEFILLRMGNELHGGVVELGNGPTEFGLTALTEVNFQLVQ